MTAQAPLQHIANVSARRDELLFQLNQHEGDPDAVDHLLIGSLADSYPPVRLRAATELAQRMTPYRAELLRQLAAEHMPDDAPAWMPAPSIEVARGAVTALRGAPQQETIEVIAELTRHPDADLRYQAMVTLFELEAHEATLRPIVDERLRDEDAEIAVVAAQIAAEFGWEDMLDVLVARRAQLSGDLRLQLTLAIVELLDDEHGLSAEVLEELWEELASGIRHEATVAASAMALVDLARATGHASRARDLLGGLLKRWMLHPLLKVEAAAQLVRLQDGRGLDYLNQSFDSRRKDARGYAIDVAGRLGLDALFGRVARAAQDPDDYHADTAILALANYDTAEARTILEELSTQAPTEDLRHLATEALHASPDTPKTLFGLH